MLEKPDLPDTTISTCLLAAYAIEAAQITFLPLGADPDTAVYRADAQDGTSYFVKLRRGSFDEIAVRFPHWLAIHGFDQIIAPLPTLNGQLWAKLDPFTLILYPFVETRNGYEVRLADHHWHELGAALKRLHTASIPPALTQRLPRETYTPHWRENVRIFLEQARHASFPDPVATQVAAILQSRHAEISALVERTEHLAGLLQQHPPEYVACHADIHGANVLIDANDKLYIVDWDTLLMAPKERDLMYAGGGQFGSRRTPHEEETLFYQGYGASRGDPAALTYYRYERIIQDIAIYCEQLLLSTEGGADREQSLQYLASNFSPNSVLTIARAADQVEL